MVNDCDYDYLKECILNLTEELHTSIKRIEQLELELSYFKTQINRIANHQNYD